MPHLIYLAVGFPPAATISAPRMRAVANGFAAAGWDVTAISLSDDAWEREMGLDRSLLRGLSPRVRTVTVDLARYDVATDIRQYTREQALDWDGWLARQRALDRAEFPEDLYGRWLAPLTEAVLSVNAERPGDLLLVCPGPYVTLGAALAATQRTGMPLAVDYRDGWAVDIISGEEQFPLASREGDVETAAVRRALQVWFINDAVRGFYAGRYPEQASRFRTVHNGYDGEPGAQVTERQGPLRFGYLGTLTLTREQLSILLQAWRLARLATPGLADATLEFRGHLGTRTVSANRNQRLLTRFERYGVRIGGPVATDDLPATYARWDCLVLALTGRTYVTSAKVYEYVATGLPVLSAHDPGSAAVEILSSYPRWVPTESLSEEDLALAFVTAAQTARATAALRPEALRYAAQYQRAALVSAAVADLLVTWERSR